MKVRSRARALRAAAATVVESLESRRMFDATVLEPDRSITDTPQTPGDTFGDYVATYGDLVAVGLPNAAGDGVVKIFNATSGAPVVTIENPDQDPDGSGFGSAMAFIDATHIAVTDFGGFSGDAEVATVRIFTLNGGATPSYVTVTAPADDDFGNTLAAVGGDLLVAAPSAFSGAGAVYRYNEDGTPVDAYTVDNSSGLGLVMAADPSGSTMLFSSGFGDARRVYEIGFGGDVVAQYDEVDDVNAFGSFAIAFNHTAVFVGDPNVGRVTQFARTAGGASGAIVGAITQSPSTGFGTSIAVNGGDVVIAAQGSNVMTVYDDDFGDSDNAPRATTQGTAPGEGQTFAFIGAVRNLTGREVLVADAFADGGAGRLYVFDLPDIGGAVTAALDNGDVIVTGTGGNDSILVKIANGSLQVFAGTELINAFNVADVTGTVIISGGGGDDTLTSDSTNTFATEIHGGDGDDAITGGGADDMLFGEGGADTLNARGGDDVALGGEGNDLLQGGQGRDVLIGGDGADRAEGEQGDDILVAGYTTHDGDVAALAAIRTAWLAPTDYLTRVTNLRNGLLNNDTDVFDDGDQDTVVGGNGQDWFLVQKDAGVLDVIQDQKKGEATSDVAP